nr:molybdate ABC transporter substrate-binding protein [Candidatus Eremiobacteraeota bacterium]
MTRATLLARAAAIGASLCLCANPLSAAGQPRVTVYAAASLREAFEAAAPAFTKQTGMTVSYSFGGSDMLVTQLKQGAPADVFASANETQMKVASDAGLLAEPARTFVRNHVVLIVPKQNAAKIAGLADLARPGVKVVLTAAGVPVGSYARAA